MDRYNQLCVARARVANRIIADQYATRNDATLDRLALSHFGDRAIAGGWTNRERAAVRACAA